MIHNNVKVIFRLAIFMGIFLPLAETVRRFHQLTDLHLFLHWFDDYILGGILIGAAIMLKKEKPNAISYMIAAWGIGTGALFLSFLGQIDYMAHGTPDPGGIFSASFVLIAKAAILIYMIYGMLRTIRAE